MKRIRRVWKVLLVFFAVGMISLAVMGCSKNEEQPSDDRSTTDHPTAEEPAAEEPAADHPAADHPSGDDSK